MGLFSGLFGGGAKQSVGMDEQARALRRYFDEKLPKNYVNSRKYAVNITKTGESYAAKITLDMQADGSDYSGFQAQDYQGLAGMESDYLMGSFLSDPPVPVKITLDMVFDGKNRVTVEK